MNGKSYPKCTRLIHIALHPKPFHFQPPVSFTFHVAFGFPAKTESRPTTHQPTGFPN